MQQLECGYNAAQFRQLPKGYDMRILQIVGAVLIVGGLFVLIKAPSYSSEKSVLKIGDVEAKVAQEHAIPPWAGGAALAAGVLFIVVGARKA
jgi:drug/metabolite transporter (DMT)-like permease